MLLYFAAIVSVISLTYLTFKICNSGTIVKKISKGYKISKEILHNYKNGAVTLRTLTDFSMFKIRVWTSKYLETGLLISSRGKYELVYYDGDVRYKTIFPKNRGVRQIIRVIIPSREDIMGKDITENILELMGPGHNFHGIPTTPKLLGWDNGFDVYYRNDKTVFCRPDDIINLRPPQE